MSTKIKNFETPYEILGTLSNGETNQDFSSILNDCQKLLRYLTYCETLPVITNFTKSQALQITLRSISSPGDEVVIVNSEKDGEEWCKIASDLNLIVHQLKTSSGKTPSIEECMEIMDKAPSAKAFCINQIDSITGIAHDLNEILTIIRTNYYSTLTIVDGTDSFGKVEIPTHAECIDIYLTGSSQTLSLPSDLTFSTIISVRSLYHLDWIIAIFAEVICGKF